MKYALKNEDYTLFVGTIAEAKEQNIWEDGVNKGQKIDEKTGLPVWTLKDAELISADGEVEKINVKILAKDKPVLSARSEHRVKGSLLLTSYTNDKTNRAALSFTVIGELVPKNATLGGLPPIK